jgi:hypothetical protein
MFSPEEKETIESGWERKGFKENLESSILNRWNAGFDTFPDPIQCPVRACKNPLKVEIRDKILLIYCTNCGFEQIIKRHKKTV